MIIVDRFYRTQSSKVLLWKCVNTNTGNQTTVFDPITAPALITPPPLTFYLIIAHLKIFFLTFYFIFTWWSFGTSGREQIYLSALGAY